MAKLDPNILSVLKAKWPEKLATIWDDAKREWIVDAPLLEKIKKRDWRGWQEEKTPEK
jgi:hypothetical protein